MRKFHHEVPGPLGIILQIFSGALAGVLIAGIYLVLKPVKFESAPTAPATPAEGAAVDRNLVTYVAGNAGHPGGQQWRVRERAFLAKAPTGVALSEVDINRWIATTYGPLDRRIELKSYGFEMTPDVPLVRVSGNEFQMGIEYRCKLGDAKKTIVAQATGHFEKDGDRHVFAPDKVYLGSCPLPGPLGALLVDKLVASYPIPDDVAASWKSVATARTEEGALKLGFN